MCIYFFIFIKFVILKNSFDRRTKKNAIIVLLVNSAKCLMFGIATLPIAAGAVATGQIFGAMNQSVARNPETKDTNFTTSLIAFALIETFVFIGIGVAFIAYFLLLCFKPVKRLA